MSEERDFVMSVSARAIQPKGTGFVEVSAITDLGRVREDLGDIEALATDIKKNGLIHPIVVRENSDGTYTLIAGGRRLAALKHLRYEVAPVNIYPEDTTEKEIYLLELCENIQRKDLTFEEECNQINRIHKTMQEMLGEKAHGRTSVEGHSMGDTAAMLGKSTGSVSQKISLARAMEVIPELKDCRTEAEAMKTLKKLQKQMEIAETVERIEAETAGTSDEQLQKNVSDSYILGNFLELSKTIPDSSADLIEIDSPYGIDIKDSGAKRAGMDVKMDYTEWTIEEYKENIKKTINEAYRILNASGWMILWFSPTYFGYLIDCITEAGFVYQFSKVPAIWAKPNGQCNWPGKRLASACEFFFYAGKEGAVINQQGRSNIFNFRPTKPTDKIHPTEKPVQLYRSI
jgi:ParB/RepB/Spo0J family partition protein